VGVAAAPRSPAAAAIKATSVALDPLPDDDARTLLVARISDARVVREPEAVNRLVALCSGYPLALSIIAGRAVTDRRLQLSALVDELRLARLDALDEGDHFASVPAALSWSYRALNPEQAELFLLLALAPGQDISLTAASSLAGLPKQRTRSLLRALERASLLLSHAPERYLMHDLVHEWASDRAALDLGEDDRDAAVGRLVEFYSHTAHHAHAVLQPHDT
jgi:hypothetical protein